MLSTKFRLGALGLTLVLSPAGGLLTGASAQPILSHDQIVLQLQLCRSLPEEELRLNCFDRLSSELPRRSTTTGSIGAGARERLEAAGGTLAVGDVPQPPARAEADEDPADVPAARRTLIVAVSDAAGAAWRIAPSPPAEIPPSPGPGARQVVEARPLSTEGQLPDVLLAEGWPGGASRSAVALPEDAPAEPAVAAAPPMPKPRPAELVRHEEDESDEAEPLVLAAAEPTDVDPPNEPETASSAETPGGSPLSSFVELFEFASPAQAATRDEPDEEMQASLPVVPLPPTPPGRTPDLTGLLAGDLPTQEDIERAREVEMQQLVALAQDEGEMDFDPEAAREHVETASLHVPRVSGIKRTWSVSGWTSPLSGARDMTLTRASERQGDRPMTLLSFSCSDSSGAVRVTWPYGTSAQTMKAALAFDGKLEDPAAWNVGDDGRTLIREGHGTALALARKVAAAERVSVRIVEDPARQWEATFGTDGLKDHIGEFAAACGKG
ncbi:hypothetical protein [Lutibaculum baratangense]|uniref:Uncharacterized protein n=1 Tax=Lutibaculum baratangense AMV1 TaxID=631454 RepID=V4TBD9_9HYPH|nr:hypothetical protein [Lutibaculum baratangense]ESR23713.1 hypothetical protein N177_2943 [Lutibaculum baratangense AMV1]